MTNPINPSRDPSNPIAPTSRSNSIDPKNPDRFKEILEEENNRTEDFLGIKLTPKEKEMVWATLLQQMGAQIKIEEDRMIEEQKKQQRKIENPDE